jgi:hypothetical protein
MSEGVETFRVVLSITENAHMGTADGAGTMMDNE